MGINLDEQKAKYDFAKLVERNRPKSGKAEGQKANRKVGPQQEEPSFRPQMQAVLSYPKSMNIVKRSEDLDF